MVFYLSFYLSLIVLLRGFVDYYNGFDDDDGKHHTGYKELIEELLNKYPLSEPRIEGEQKIKEFLALFGSILRMKNLLMSFDDFKGYALGDINKSYLSLDIQL